MITNFSINPTHEQMRAKLFPMGLNGVAFVHSQNVRHADAERGHDNMLLDMGASEQQRTAAELNFVVNNTIEQQRLAYEGGVVHDAVDRMYEDNPHDPVLYPHLTRTDLRPMEMIKDTTDYKMGKRYVARPPHPMDVSDKVTRETKFTLGPRR